MVVYFFQRYASFFAILAAMVSYRLVLPDGSPWWQELALGMGVGAAVYVLLQKNGVTYNRPKRSIK